MQYRKFGKTGLNVSAIGIGTKRLPEKIGSDGRITIDREKSIGIIRKSIDRGINYIDTAYSYYNGEAEKIVGEALKCGYREKAYIATKCPLWLINSPEDFDKILDIQLERMGVEYIDFYMFHSLNCFNWNDTVLSNKLYDKMKEAQRNGKIKHIGFSFHDTYEMFETVIRVYDWDFCQLQVNYINYDKEATLNGIKLAAEKGVAVVAVEVLNGGSLVSPPVNVANVLWDIKTAVEWAYDYVWNMAEVSVVLTGAQNDVQLEENISYAERSEVGMLLPKEVEMFETAKKIYDTVPLINCSRCAYCMPCPIGINIPKIFMAYNLIAIKGKEEALKMYSENKISADSCKDCKVCERLCPNLIKISDKMQEISKAFDKII